MSKMDRSQERSVAVFIIGTLSFILLWLPPLPYSLKASDFPSFLLSILSNTGLIRATDCWSMRLDYFVFPILFFYAGWTMRNTHISWIEFGFGYKNFIDAARCLFLPTLLGALALLAIGAINHSIDISPRFWKRLNPLAALIQQIVIQCFFHRQLIPWFESGRRTAWILTLFFVALHVPNPGLMIGTLFGMYFWARCYQQKPNLYALALSHSILSAILMHTMPKWLLPSVSVGHRFVEKGIANHWWAWSCLR